MIAGQGTIGMEILRQCQGPLDAIFVAIGGGGLIAGIAAYVKRVRPEIKVIGVEPVDSDAMTRSLAAGQRVKLAHVGLFADGVAVKQVGKETFRIARELVDEMMLVDTDATCAAIKDVFEDTRAILEPAGALAIAGVKAWCEKHRAQDRTFVAIACGANMNFDRLRFVAERAELGEEREAILAVTIPERPGSFREFCALLGKRNVTEFNYRYADPKVAHVFVGVEVAGRAEAAGAARAAAQAAHRGLRPHRQRDGEAARAPPGGRPCADGARTRSSTASSFPSGPGALMHFLDSMSARLEHQPLPLPQPRRGLRPRAGGHAGAAAGQRRIQTFSGPAGLYLRRRIRESGLSDVPRAAELRRGAPSAAPAVPHGGTAASKFAGVLRFALFRRSGVDSGKLYALGQFAWTVADLNTTSASARSRARNCCRCGSELVADQIPLQGVKVMVIDDSNTIRRSAEIFLLQAGCTVILAEDGFDALAKIADHQPDLVFVDIMMPRLDGYQTCALIKKNHEVPAHAGDHAVVEGRPVRPRARPHGRIGPVPDQAVHQGEPAQGRRGARAIVPLHDAPKCSRRRNRGRR